MKEAEDKGFSGKLADSLSVDHSASNINKTHQTSSKLQQHAGAFLSVKQAAGVVGVSALTITRWCESGKLPAMAVPYGSRLTYRISPAALELVKAYQCIVPTEKSKQEAKPDRPHCDYLTDWQAAMARGTLTGKAFSPRTIECYSLYVNKYLEKHSVISVKGLESDLLLIPGKHYAKRDKLWKSVLCFGKYLIRQGALDKAFLEQMKPIEPKRHLPPKRFTVDEQAISCLIAACETLQERLIVLLLSSTGLRASEACALEWADINFEQGFLIVRCGKGGKTRRVGLSATLLDLLSQHRADEFTGAQRVFSNRLGKPLERNGLYQRLERIGGKAGITVTPHALRRAFVTINANKGRPLQMLQMACGHSDITTTRSYCLTSEQEVVDAMKGWD